MSICQRKVNAKGSIAPGSPASPAEVDKCIRAVELMRIGSAGLLQSVFECPELTFRRLVHEWFLNLLKNLTLPDLDKDQVGSE
ncbi:hypothetical protein B0H14DRAFT_3908068 [Mycena olivaceomarginata]|nr:hypothetical protein B0H14DRAFT_3908068 [Mycena olivaceomarginata]